MGFFLSNRFLRELVINLIGSIYLIPYRIMSLKTAARKVLKSIKERREVGNGREKRELKI